MVAGRIKFHAATGKAPYDFLSKFCKMRHHRLVHGNHVYCARLPSPQRTQSQRCNLPVDVSHIRLRCSFKTLCKAAARRPNLVQRLLLYVLNLLCGIPVRYLPWKTWSLSLGLSALPLEHQAIYPTGLRPLLVCRGPAI